MRISLIVARAGNGVIGKDGAVPWRISADMKYFKQSTLGKPIVMGRKTFQSLGRPLPERLNIVVSRDKSFRAEGVTVVHSLDEALSAAAGQDALEVMIIGGAEIYKQALPQVERIYLTEVHGDVDGDTFFPELEKGAWQEVSRDFVSRGEKASHDCSFVILQRVP